MLSNVPRRLLDSLTIKDLEDLLELKKKNTQLSDLLKERDRLRLELRRIEDSIEALERVSAQDALDRADEGPEPGGPSFLAGRRKKKDRKSVV